MVALPFISKDLAQIHFQFITNILIVVLLSIHHKFTTIQHSQGFIHKAWKTRPAVLPVRARRRRRSRIPGLVGCWVWVVGTRWQDCRIRCRHGPCGHQVGQWGMVRRWAYYWFWASTREGETVDLLYCDLFNFWIIYMEYNTYTKFCAKNIGYSVEYPWIELGPPLLASAHLC